MSGLWPDADPGLDDSWDDLPDGDSGFSARPHPHPDLWPSIPADTVAGEWERLASWVRELQGRFAHLDHHVIPPCWWRHNGHVEALVALRGHERMCFDATAPATAPVDWLRALRDIAALLAAWTSDAGCGATHQPPIPVATADTDRAGWERHVAGDTARRRTRPT